MPASTSLALWINLARSGGTLISRCLGCMNAVALLGEVLPLGVKMIDRAEPALYLRGRQAFAELAVKVGFLRFEGLTFDPDAWLGRRCAGLGVGFDPAWRYRYRTYPNITGDEEALAKAIGEIRPARRHALDPATRAVFESSDDYAETCRFLGYDPVQPHQDHQDNNAAVSLPDSDIIRRRVVVLGSTGSIGTQTLDAIAHLNTLAERGHSNQRFDVVGLAARSRGDDLAAQAQRFGVPRVALADSEADVDTPAHAIRGTDAPEQLVRETKPDLVVAAMVGAAGLPATLAAAELGIDVALANKEALVAAGHLVVPLARRAGSRLLPIDSEHSGLWQCLQGLCPRGEHIVPPSPAPPIVQRAIITASGGPFRLTPLDEVCNATVEQALAHPTWAMGPKNTIDSATMINKGLELIEARWLFDLDADRLGVLIHPQSIVHAIVELADGSSIAQLSAPDMRCPIQLALTWPTRAPGCAATINWQDMATLEFAEPDPERFPAIALALEVIGRGGGAGAAFNAANEVAVRAFLDHAIPFGRIVEVVAATLDQLSVGRAVRQPETLEAVMAVDATARDVAYSVL